MRACELVTNRVCETICPSRDRGQGGELGCEREAVLLVPDWAQNPAASKATKKKTPAKPATKKTAKKKPTAKRLTKKAKG